MRILVINGSPKGENSITLQTVKYWEILYKEHTFTYLHAGARIGSLEKDPSPLIPLFREAELVLFAYPVYTFLAPSQLHRFIRLMKEQAFPVDGLYAAQVTTSKHFYDTTAQRYVRDNCADMGMRYLGGLPADMDDLTLEKGRREAHAFFEHMLWCAQNGICEPPVPAPAPAALKTASVPAPAEKRPGFTVSLVTDIAPEDASLRALRDRFLALCPYEVKTYDIRTFPFRGGCLGCFKCAADGTCVYKDGYAELLRNIQSGDAIVLAFSVSDHSMGTRFKTYDDRQFANGHRTVTEGTPFGYLVSGALSREENLREVIESRAQVGGNFLAGIASDEYDPDGSTDRLVASLCYAVEHHYAEPKNFYGVGGMKIFRDLIYMMRGLMREDHRFFKTHGLYDFPQKQKKRILLMYPVGALMRNKKLQQKAGGKINEGMLGPYAKVLEEARKASETRQEMIK